MRAARCSTPSTAIVILLATLLWVTMSSGQAAAQAPATGAPPPAVTAIRAGRLLDHEMGRLLTNQIILVEGTRIRDVGPNLSIPAGAQVIDLSQSTVMPGLVEAHNHLALTYKPVPENNVYYYTYVQDSTPLRAIQAASNGIQMRASGFTIVRDMGNDGNYADTALRQAIEQGWIPGPTIINSAKRVHFVMKDGLVFKKDGVMTPAAFFHAGPVNGWRIR